MVLNQCWSVESKVWEILSYRLRSRLWFWLAVKLHLGSYIIQIYKPKQWSWITLCITQQINMMTRLFSEDCSVTHVHFRRNTSNWFYTKFWKLFKLTLVNLNENWEEIKRKFERRSCQYLIMAMSIDLIWETFDKSKIQKNSKINFK